MLSGMIFRRPFGRPLMQAHLSSPKLADQLFDELANNLPNMWRFERIERNRSHGVWYVWAHTPTGPGTASGVAGSGPTISVAVQDLYRRIAKYDHEHGRTSVNQRRTE